MDCAICGTPAEDLTPADFDGLIIRCRHCGEYEISGTISDDFLRLDLSARAEVLRKPVIIPRCF